MPSIKQLYENPNVVAFITSTVIIVAFVEIVKVLARNGHLSAWRRRKLLHILTGPIFILTWPLFTNTVEGSHFAAAVPAVMTLKFFLIGAGYLKDPDTVNSACRSGKREELLKGPLLYGIIFILSTVMYWKQLRGVLCLFVLCFGDGFAEICGRSFGRDNKIPWCKDKSFAGTLGFIGVSTLFTVLFIRHFGHSVLLSSETVGSGCFLLSRVLFVSVVAGVVETLPIPEVDNVTIFVGAILADQHFMSHPYLVC